MTDISRRDAYRLIGQGAGSSSAPQTTWERDAALVITHLLRSVASLEAQVARLQQRLNDE